MNLAPLVDATVMAAAGAVTALAGLVIAKLPLLVTYVRVRINGADAELVRHAIANAARNAATEMDRGLGAELAIRDMARYVLGALPDTTKRMGLSRGTLEAMCRAEMARLLAERG